MKVRIKVCHMPATRREDDLFGIELLAQNEDDDKTLRRFWDGGIKVNAITPRPNNETSLELTFADLIGK